MDMPIAKHKEEVILLYLVSLQNKAENHVLLGFLFWCFVPVLSIVQNLCSLYKTIV